jgi:sugar lactone lactonase YvrE
VQQVVGCGEEGLQDGPAATARFSAPQGMAVADGSLYVADTESHAVRRIDLSDWSVETVAGTGEQADRQVTEGDGRRTALSSPWDLAVSGATLTIAMAGLHQLWSLDLGTGVVRPFAGSGREGIEDGPATSAWFAQPSGLAAAGERLYVADSETSAIREVSLPSGRVSTVVGQGLFEFGDVDGVGDAVRLQHPLGIWHHDGALYVADSYNNKVKRVLPRTRASATLLGDGAPGYQDGAPGAARFREPGGLCVADGRLYVADTNNHAIRVADLGSLQVETLKIGAV